MYKCTYTYIHVHIYASNLIYRNRATFYFFKSYLNGVFCDNANQFILTCWTHLVEVFS